MKRKILSLILVFAMTVSLFTVGTGAVEPTYGDTAGHWAESSIERWSAYGIIQGSNGQFDPNGQLTCAQLATILAKLLKLPAAKDAGFTDNTADAWYYDAINRCAAAGILNGNGDGTVTPEAPITRERAMVMLARALGIEPIRKPDLTKYTDAAQVPAYAQGYVAALIEAGIVGGVTADELAPQDNINRASTVTILDRAISVYADKDGMTVNAKDGELVLVVAKNVKVINAPEGTKIVVADGATGLTVNGKSVSDDQTYIVPKTTTSSGSSSSGGGHSHSYTSTVTKEPTCTEKGEKTFTCTRDGSTYTEEIPALGHALGGWVKDNNHLSHTRTCTRSNCSYSETENCKYTVTTANNKDTYTCPVCGDTYEVEKDSAVRIGETGYATLDEALAVTGEGYTIVLLKDLEVTAQINVTKSVTIEGAGHTIKANNASWPTGSEYNHIKHLLNITASNVTIKNLTLDSNNQACGNQAWADPDSSKITNVKFTDVTMKGSLNAGLIVKHAEVTAENLTTSDNAWGGVNVDGGTPHFTLTGNSTLNEDNKIWAEKANGPAVVTADGYYCHLIKDEKNREFYAWSTSVSADAVAKAKVEEVDVYYTSLEKALSETIGTVEITLVKGKIAAVPAITDRMVTLVGEDKEASIIDMTKSGIIGAQNANLELTIKNATVKFDDKANYKGITHSKKVVYEGCIIEGKQFLYAESVEFKNCELKNSNDYCLWTYGSANVLFDTCTFNTGGKAIFIYNEKTNEGFTAAVIVNSCIFNDDDTLKENNGTDDLLKAAIETGSNGGNTETSNKYTIVVNNATVNGFAARTSEDGRPNLIPTNSTLWANKDGMDDAHLSITIDGMKQKTVKVNSYETLKAAISALGNNSLTLDIDGDITVPEGETWKPISVDGSQGNGTLTINGNGHKIVGLNAPLVANTWAGKSNCIIKGLTLENANIVVDEKDANGNVGVGAFIGQPCASQIITLENCNLVNSTVKGGHWAGGLIGVSGGYNGTDGPVFENVTIKNCSVTSSTIESKGSVGAIIGHAAWDNATRVDITGCTVTGNTVKSTGSSNEKAGSLMGTVGCAGSNLVNSDLEPHAEPGVFVTNCTVNDNNVTSNTTTITEVYGRQGSTGGKLVVDGVTKCQ